jgi:hypothetical protein
MAANKDMIMTWFNPVPYRLIATEDSFSFKEMPVNTTGIPLAPHPGAFGVQRKTTPMKG